MRAAAAIAAIVLATVALPARANAARLADIAFMQGNWTSDRSGFVIEESWTDARAGVLLGMSRGVQNGSVRFLRFAVLEQVGDEVIMRFKRYNPDYSSWELEGPSVMRLTRARAGEVIFEATDPASDVQRIIYRMRADGAVDVIANRADEKGPYLVEFTLSKAG